MFQLDEAELHYFIQLSINSDSCELINTWRYDSIIWHFNLTPHCNKNKTPLDYLKKTEKNPNPNPNSTVCKESSMRLKRLSWLKIMSCVGYPAPAIWDTDIMEFVTLYGMFSINFQFTTESHQTPDKMIFTSSFWQKYEEKLCIR